MKNKFKFYPITFSWFLTEIIFGIAFILIMSAQTNLEIWQYIAFWGLVIVWLIFSITLTVFTYKYEKKDKVKD